jgi:BirA family biotin operon repressor/biotin-[acetyl-CoA-carboxylase] ligase
MADRIRRVALDSIGSTNDEALARARAGEAGPLWITARMQSAGRGRRGRAWTSAPGNLHATLLLADPCPPARAAELSFVAALAVHDALAAAAPRCAPRLLLKWPNDVLISGRKVSGILVEGESAGGRFAAAVGIGINCRHHPDDTAYPATDLAAEGLAVEAEDLFALLDVSLQQRVAQWDRGDGFAAIRADWARRASAPGDRVSVRLPDRVVSGTFQGVDDRGRLLLQSAAGVPEVIAAGDVFALGRPAEGRS